MLDQASPADLSPVFGKIVATLEATGGGMATFRRLGDLLLTLAFAKAPPLPP